MKPPLTRDELAKLVEEGLENGGYLMFRFGHGQIRQLRPDETETVLGALKATPPEVARILTDDQIMNAAIQAADELDATRVSERRNGAWHATTIFDGDTGLLRFGRLVEKALLSSHGPQRDEGKKT